MNKKYLWVAIACLILPPILRVLWFYPGTPSRPDIKVPEFGKMTVPAPPQSESKTKEKIKEVGGAVIIDTIHGNQFQPSEINSLTQALAQRGARVEYSGDAASLETQLKYASAYAIISPSIPFTADEIRMIEGFTQNGGKLAVFADATRGVLTYDFFTGNISQFPDVNAINPLLAQYDISINNDYLYDIAKNEGNFRNVYFEEFGKSEVAYGLKQVVLYGTHSVGTASGTPLLLGTEKTLSSLTDATPSKDSVWGAAVVSKDGSAIAFGDFTFLADPYNSVANNSSLIGNIADHLLSGQRKATLANYPYIFSDSSVNILPTSEVQMTAEMVAALARFQAAFHLLNINTKVTDKSSVDGDLIVLGTFDPSDDLDSFTEAFDLTLDDSTEYIDLPNFGHLGRAGNGVILFESGRRGNTLVLLADTMDDLTYLLDGLSSGSISACLSQGNTAVCSVGYGGSFSEEGDSSDTTGDGTTEEAPSGATNATPESAPLPSSPEPTPTPGG